MKIFFLQNNVTSFGAKKSEIRDADRIMRASARTFPVVSPSYIDTFYSSEKAKEGMLKRVSDRIFKNVRNIRIFEEKLVALGLKIPDNERSILNAPILRGMQQLKSGNCNEMSIAVLGALAANGIYDAEICSLWAITEFVSKKDGSVVATTNYPVDHCFVVTSMGKNSTKEKDLVVIDPWLSFCDSISAARGKYKQIFEDKVQKNILGEQWSNFRYSQEQKGEEFDREDYIPYQKLHLTLPEFSKKSSSKSFAKYCADNFPSLIVGERYDASK